jgi:hypothetical protein
MEEKITLRIVKHNEVVFDNLGIQNNTCFFISDIKRDILKYNLVAYSLIENDKKVGYALIKLYDPMNLVHELMYFEIFPSSQRKGYGVFFAKYIIKNYNIHLHPINGSVLFWMNLGAKLLYSFCGGYMLCITEFKPSEYLKLLFNKDMDENIKEICDNFVYVREEWIEYAKNN